MRKIWQSAKRRSSGLWCTLRLRPRRLLAVGAVVALGCAALPAMYQASGIFAKEVSYIASAELYPLAQKPPYTVAIDAGHGGTDSGAKGLVDEIVVCEATVDKLFALLESDPNFDPVRTRQNGENPSIATRAQVAIDSQAALLLSIHANCDQSTRQSHGFECFPAPPGRVYHEQSMRFARCLADQMAAAGHRLHGENGVRFAYYNGRSKRIVPGTDTRVRTSKSFGIVEKPACPAVLAEQCFLTNYNDVEQWTGEDGCERAALAYYKAICAYFATEAFPAPTPTPGPPAPDSFA